MTYHARLRHLQQTLQKEGCDALFVDDETNLYYLTGLDLSSGSLLVHAKGATLLVDGRYLEICKKSSPFPAQPVPEHSASFFETPEFSHIRKLGFDSNTTSYKEYERLKKLFKNVNFVPIDSPLKLQRAIKGPEELSILREAAAMGSQGFDFLLTLLKEGITEHECAVELEIFWKRLGGKTVAFDPIIAFGSHSSMPHYRAGSEKLKSGDIVLVDIGVNFKHYHSDMTRIAFFGKPNTRLLAIHAIVQKAQQAALNLCRPGTTLGSLDAAARQVIASHGYEGQFTHSLGHGIGLNIHEYPTVKNAPPFNNVPLAPGMVITIEPGIYLEGIGGVRIEDTVAITEKGYEDLTKRSTDPIFL